MKNILFVLLFLLFIKSLLCQDIISIHLSELENTKYECDIGGCTPSTIISSFDFDSCRIACLQDTQCRTVTFDSNTNLCETFADIPSQYGKLSSQSGVTTMITTDQRLLSARKFQQLINSFH